MEALKTAIIPAATVGIAASNGGNNGGNGGNGGGNGGGSTITASWPTNTVQIYLDMLGVEHDQVPQILNDAITSYAVSPDSTTAQNEKAFSIACMGGGSLINAYIDILVANGYSYHEEANSYATAFGEIYIGLDAVEGNLVIIVMLPDAGGGGGGGGDAVPDNSRFLNAKIVTQDISTNPSTPSMEDEYQESYIAFFDDLTCELVAHYNDKYNVIFGTYRVNQLDNVATISVKKMYNGEYEYYTWSIPTQLQSIQVEYLQESDTFVTDVHQSGYITMSLTLRKYPNPPMHIVGDGVPRDPNGDEFDSQYQVEQDRYNHYLGDKSYNTHSNNLTVTATGPFAGFVDETYVMEQEGNKFHKYTPGSENPDLEEFYEVQEVNRNAQDEITSLTVDVYYHTEGAWHVNYDATHDPDWFQERLGFVPVRFLSTTYIGSENAHYYMASNTSYQNYSAVADPETVQITNFKASFENNYIKSVSYRKDGSDFSFVVSKVNSTTFELPDVGGGGGGNNPAVSWPSQYIADALETWGIEHDTVPSVNMTGVTSINTYPLNAVENSDHFFYISIFGGSKGSDYIAALGLADYELISGTYVTDYRELAISITPSGENLSIMVSNEVPNLPTTTYPASRIASYLDGTTDSIIEFTNANAVSYVFEPTDPDYGVYYTNLALNFEGEVDYESICKGFENSLIALGYGYKIDQNYYGWLLVSPNRQVGFFIGYEESYQMVTVGIVNFQIPHNAPDFYVNYVFTWTGTGYDLDAPEFYGWVWTADDNHKWIRLIMLYNMDEGYDYLVPEDTLSDEYIGIRIFRWNPGAALKPTVDDTEFGFDENNVPENTIWNRTNNIDISGNASDIEFSFTS